MRESSEQSCRRGERFAMSVLPRRVAGNLEEPVTLSSANSDLIWQVGI
jgi:hypothetical protein